MTQGGWDQSNHHISSRSKRTGTFSYMSCHHSCHNFLLHHQNDQIIICHVLYVAKHFEWNYFFHLSSPERFLLWDQSNEFVTGVHLKIDSNLRCAASLTCCWRCSSQRHEIRSCSLFQVSGHVSRSAACGGMQGAVRWQQCCPAATGSATSSVFVRTEHPISGSRLLPLSLL